jgi:hypothetical protein
MDHMLEPGKLEMSLYEVSTTVGSRHSVEETCLVVPAIYTSKLISGQA